MRVWVLESATWVWILAVQLSNCVIFSVTSAICPSPSPFLKYYEPLQRILWGWGVILQIESLAQCCKTAGERVFIAQSYLTFCNLWTAACQTPLSLEFSRQEYWNGLPFCSPGDFTDSENEPESPTLQIDPLLSEPPEKPKIVSTQSILAIRTLWESKQLLQSVKGRS